MDVKLSEKKVQNGHHHVLMSTDRMVNGKRLDDSEKIRSLTRTLQNQIKQASKKELMGDSKKDGKVLFFARENVLLFVLLLISVLSIYNFWFTHNYWKLIRQRNMLEPDSRALHLFQNVPMENMKLCISIFNYTNVDEYYLNTSVPFKVESLGPYCFRDTPSKKNIIFNEDKTQISFQENSSIEFLYKESNGTLDDLIVVPNIPLLSVCHQVLERNVFVGFTMAAKIRFNKYEPFLTMRVQDFMFGYDDELLEWIYKMGQIGGFETPMRRFSLLDRVMFNINSNYTLDTGKDDITKLGDLKVYNGKTELDVWKTPECNEFRGSYGAYWVPQDVREGHNLSFFNGYLCRNVPLLKEKDTKYANFISVVRYQSAPDLFTYPSDSDESCYCLAEPCTDNLFNVGACLKGPFVLSYKNFHGVNRSVLSHIDFEKLGTLSPDDDSWKTYFDIHPGLGNTVSFKTTFQMNVQVKKNNKNSDLVQFPMPLENGLILPAVIIQRSGPRLNTKTTYLLIFLSVLEGTLQYGAIILTLVLLYVLLERWRSLSQLLYVYNVTVSPPLPYQQAIVTIAEDHKNNNHIYSQL